MKGPVLLLLPLFLLFSGCNLREREEALRLRETALNEREQQLMLREETLQVKEAALNQRTVNVDSTRLQDTTHVVNPALAGNWQVKMTCTETTCPGSAVGDTKTEQWNFAYQDNRLVVKAVAGEQLARVYTGYSTASGIELAEENAGAGNQPAAKMMVRLHRVDDTRLEGQREIIRENDCRIVYALQLQKQ